MTTVRGRFAPSPSGEMHLGNAWTALLAWLEVRKLNGLMILRIEDLDPCRCRPEYTERLLADLAWLGLDWDEGPNGGGNYGPYCQSERRHLYDDALKILYRRGSVYDCYCTRAEIHAASMAPHGGENFGIYPGTCARLAAGEIAQKQREGRRPAVRLAVLPGVESFVDGLYGKVTYDLTLTSGDFIIRRSDGIHAYQLAVVVDDALMHISHVLRGDDLLDSTPRQLLLYHLLGYTPPQFTHVSLLYGEDGHRLSKRQKDLSLAALRQKGVLAETVIGYLAWKANLLDSFQPVKAAELIGGFSLAKLPRTAVIVEKCTDFFSL